MSLLLFNFLCAGEAKHMTKVLIFLTFFQGSLVQFYRDNKGIVDLNDLAAGKIDKIIVSYYT